MQIELDFIIEECQRNLDTDPRYWNEDEGCVTFGKTPVFYTRHDTHFVLEIEGVEFYAARA